MSNSKPNIILIGAGGHCVSVIDVIEQEDKYNILGVLDLKKKYSSFEAGNQNYTQEEKTEIDRLLKEIADTDNIIKSQFHNKS